MTVTINDFLFFINERTAIKAKKDAGLSAPWTSDKVLQMTKFCNLDRNHDYGTESLIAFTKGMSMVSTIFYIVMFRCCYSSRNFFPQMTGNWIKDIQFLRSTKLTNLGRMPYQVYLKKGQAINDFLSTTAFDIVKVIVSNMHTFHNSSIESVADLIADAFKEYHEKRLIFLGTEIAKDIAAIYPEKVDPDSWCHFNTGAQKSLKALARGNWKQKAQMLVTVTGLNPSTVENLCCEVGKLAIRRDFYNLNGYFKKAWLYTPSVPVVKPKIVTFAPIPSSSSSNHKKVI